MNTNNDGKIVLVTGMHRSGTSAVARALLTFNINLGDSLVAAQDDNVTGFWEDSDFKILNQDMLNALGRDWDSLSVLSFDEATQKKLASFSWRAYDLIKDKLKHGGVLGLKDPRTAILLPFWQKVFSQVGVDVSYILAVRHPLSVARSLKKRNSIEALPAFYLWLQYNLNALENLIDRSATVIDYDLLLREPSAELFKVGAALGLGEPSEKELKEYAENYLEAGLRHTFYTVGDLESELIAPPLLGRVYDFLNQLACGSLSLQEKPTRELYTKLKHDFGLNEELLFYLEQQKTHFVGEVSKIHNSYHQKLNEFEIALKKRDSKISELKFSLESQKVSLEKKREAELNDLNSKFERQRSSLTREISNLKAAHKNDIKEKALRAEEQIKRLKNQLDQSNKLAHSSKIASKKRLEKLDNDLRRSKEKIQYLETELTFQSKERSSTRLVRGKKVIRAIIAGKHEKNNQSEEKLSQDLRFLSNTPLFDSGFYLKQNPDVAKAGVEPVQHYIKYGSSEGRRPHPLFNGAWYLQQNPDVAAERANPLIHYLQFGAQEGRDPHYLFSGDDYWIRYPEVKHKGLSPLEHYVAEGSQQGYKPHALYSRAIYLRQHPQLDDGVSDPFIDCVQCCEQSRPTVFQALAADSSLHETFPEEQQAALLKRLKRRYALNQGCLSAPLISIIMPTRNRRFQISSAVDSILAQTWQNWELHIIDDGSTDDTVEFLKEHYQDARINVHTTEATGVSAARNVGLQQAKGEWFAYLDSDNSWDTDFLWVMLNYAQQEHVEFAYAAIRLSQDDGISYRYHEFVPDDLLIKNFIDLNAVFHHRRLCDEYGGFDTGLLRTVDWDLAIRYTQNARKVAFVPFVGVDYDDRQSAQRITVQEFNAWRFVVVNKHMVDWQAAKAKSVTAGLSIIIPALGSPVEMQRCLEALLNTVDTRACRIIVVDNGNHQAMLDLLNFAATANDAIRHLVNRGALTRALAFNIGASQADTDKLLFLDVDAAILSGGFEPLLAALQTDQVGFAQPKVLSEDGLVHHIGFDVAVQNSLPYPVYAGFPAHSPCVNIGRACFAAGQTCLAVWRDAFIRVGGFWPLYVNAYEGVDLSLRLADAGLTGKYVPESVVILHTSSDSRKQKNEQQHLQANRRVFQQRWAERVRSSEISSDYYAQDGFAVVAWQSDGFEPAELALMQPVLGQSNAAKLNNLAAETEKPLIAIKIACPDAKQKQEWGDYHFACSLGAALQRLGYEYRIDFRTEWQARSEVAANEVNIVLRGRGAVPLRDDQLNLMWLISHPDKVSVNELKQYDHVFVASEPYTAVLQEVLGEEGQSRVSCLLQCTDPALFYPGQREETLAHDVLFVGNSRNEYRESVRLALEAGLRPAVYGTRWQQFIPKDLIKGENIPNYELARYYRSAKVVLNDHWPDMREKGFVSNRVFDVLACGGQIVSDNIEGVPDDLSNYLKKLQKNNDFIKYVFDAMSTYHTCKLKNFEAALRVHETHSFDQRSRAIVARICHSL